MREGGEDAAAGFGAAEDEARDVCGVEFPVAFGDFGFFDEDVGFGLFGLFDTHDVNMCSL